MALAIGSAAPDFELVNQHGEKISLSSYKGKKNVVVIFYPFAFSGICTGELCALRDDLSA
ncbi:MAG: peroxiredoxin, partial [Actinobacteria bacterium]|nr:peroxiredoxin [Actinomycetota bacterium]